MTKDDEPLPATNLLYATQQGNTLMSCQATVLSIQERKVEGKSSINKNGAKKQQQQEDQHAELCPPSVETARNYYYNNKRIKK